MTQILLYDGSTKHATKVAQEALNRNFILLMSKKHKHMHYDYEYELSSFRKPKLFETYPEPLYRDVPLYDTKFGMDKATRLSYHETQMTHAMLFTGVDVLRSTDDGGTWENTSRMIDVWMGMTISATTMPKMRARRMDSAVIPAKNATTSVPIVFVAVPDPVGSGFVESLPRPGGNATGFMDFEYGISAKWLELLKEIVPRLARVAIPAPAGRSTKIFLKQTEASARALGVQLIPLLFQGPENFEDAFTTASNEKADAFLVRISAGTAAAHRRQPRHDITGRVGLDRDEGARKGSHEALRDSQRLRRRQQQRVGRCVVAGPVPDVAVADHR